MFFNSKKYTEEAEKNRKHNIWQEPSMFNMISLGLLASFAPTRPLLRMHKKRIEDSVKIEEKKGILNKFPLFIFMVFVEEITQPK